MIRSTWILLITYSFLQGCQQNKNETKNDFEKSPKYTIDLDTLNDYVIKYFLDENGNEQEYSLTYDLDGKLKVVSYVKDGDNIGITDYFDDSLRITERAIHIYEDNILGVEQVVYYNTNRIIDSLNSNFIDFEIENENYKIINNKKIITNISCNISSYHYDSILVYIYKRNVKRDSLIPVDSLTFHTDKFQLSYEFDEPILPKYDVVLKIITAKHWDDHPGKIGMIEYNVNLMGERIAVYPVEKYKNFNYWTLNDKR